MTPPPTPLQYVAGGLRLIALVIGMGAVWSARRVAAFVAGAMQ